MFGIFFISSTSPVKADNYFFHFDILYQHIGPKNTQKNKLSYRRSGDSEISFLFCCMTKKDENIQINGTPAPSHLERVKMIFLSNDHISVFTCSININQKLARSFKLALSMEIDRDT